MGTVSDNHRIEHEIGRIFDNNPRYRREIPKNTIENSPKTPTLATPDPELVEIDDDHQINNNNKPYPGIDDGFFSETPDFVHDESSHNPDGDVEILRNDHDHSDGEDIPEITPRAGSDGDQPDEADAAKPLNPGAGGNARRRFPLFPDLEIGTNPDIDGISLPDVNVYQHKKTLAQGMMDLALFSANANQLRYVIESGSHPYFYPSVVMISMSLLFQIAVGMGLIWNATYNVKNEKEMCIANKINNFTVIGIFLVTVINVFISAFGVASPAVANPT